MSADDEALYQRALALVLEHHKASTSWLQRQLRIGYNSAARMIERMESEGAVGRPDHVGRRKVLQPPSSTLPGSSVAPPNAWERNAGRWDNPSSAAPVAADDELPAPSTPAPAPMTVIAEEPEGLSDAVRIAGDLVSLLGLEGARRTVRAAAESQGIAQPTKAEASKATHLQQIVERAEQLFEQRDSIAQDVRDLFKFAKDIGLDPPAIRACVKARATDKDKRFEAEATLTVYRHALGIEDPDFAVELPVAAVPPPPRERKLTAKEKAYQETLASVAASRAILVQ